MWLLLTAIAILYGYRMSVDHNQAMPAPVCCQVGGRPNKYLTSSKRQHAALHARDSEVRGLRRN